MKKIISLVIILFCSKIIFSQNIINHEKETTYGTYNQTNRDNLTSTLKDRNNNIYLIGSTENDFSFNDLKIVKLDANLNVLWEQEKSFESGISFDNVFFADIDSFNNLIIISSLANTSSNQTFIITKYDENGNFKWNYTLSDISNPENIDYWSVHSYIDDNDNINLKYKPLENNPNKRHYFDKISPSGKKIESFTKALPFKNEDNTENSYKLLHNNNLYNIISANYLSSAPYVEFKLHQFNKNNSTTASLSLTGEEIDYFNTAFSESWTQLFSDKQNNLVLIAPRYGLENDFGILYIDINGTIKYSKLSHPSKDRYVLDVGFDSSNNLIVISNNKNTDTTDNL